jgi:hypothetical protein
MISQLKTNSISPELLSRLSQSEYLHPLVLRSLGWTYERIAVSLDCSDRLLRCYAEGRTIPPPSKQKLAALIFKDAIKQGSIKFPHYISQYVESSR